MKKILILTTLLLLSLITFSQNQNGGQWAENNALKIEYLGYSNGIHVIKLYNKQTCDVTVKTKVLGRNDEPVQILASSFININIPENPGVEVVFKAKPETACSQETDMGWVENRLPGGILNLVEDNHIRIVRGPNTYEVSLKNSVLISDFGSLSELQHVIICDNVGRVLFTQKSFVKQKQQINLRNYLGSGINYVRVFIQNKQYDNFVFKILK
jgi:hypothetical protein